MNYLTLTAIPMPFPLGAQNSANVVPTDPYFNTAMMSFRLIIFRSCCSKIAKMYLHMPENKQRNMGHLSCKTASEQFNPVTFSDDKRYLRAKCKTNAWPSNVTISFQNLEDERYSVLCFETQYQLWMLYCSCQSGILTGCNSPAGLISDYTDSWPQTRQDWKEAVYSACSTIAPKNELSHKRK